MTTPIGNIVHAPNPSEELLIELLLYNVDENLAYFLRYWWQKNFMVYGNERKVFADLFIQLNLAYRDPPRLQGLCRGFIESELTDPIDRSHAHLLLAIWSSKK